MLQKLSEIGCNGGFFARRQRTGGHAASIEAILSGGIDAAAIDSTVLALRLRAQPDLAGQLRVIESLGPFPIQPVVMRAALGPAWGPRIAAALRALGRGPEGADGLARFGFEGCVEIDDAAYAAERCALRDLGVLPG